MLNLFAVEQAIAVGFRVLVAIATIGSTREPFAHVAIIITSGVTTFVAFKSIIAAGTRGVS